MSYPPKGAKRPADLGAPPAAKVLYIDRRDAGGGGAAVCAHHALHSRVDDPATLLALLARAAEAASGATAELERLERAARRALPADAQRQLGRRARVLDDHHHDRAHDHLWAALDPPLASKSAAVRSAAQAASLETLCFPPSEGEAEGEAARARFGAPLREWLGLAERVARGARHPICSPALVSGRAPRCSCVKCTTTATLDGTQACQKEASKEMERNLSARKIKAKKGRFAEIVLLSQRAMVSPQVHQRPRLKHDDIVQSFGERLVP